MQVKTVIVIFFVTLSVSLSKEDSVVNKSFDALTHFTKKITEVVENDLNECSEDINCLFRQYDVADTANQAKIYFQHQLKRAIGITNKHIKQGHIKSEEALKKIIKIIEKEDKTLGEKLSKLYEKILELGVISEDIHKYMMDEDQIDECCNKAKSSLSPLSKQAVLELTNKFESKAFAYLIKKSNTKI